MPVLAALAGIAAIGPGDAAAQVPDQLIAALDRCLAGAGNEGEPGALTQAARCALAPPGAPARCDWAVDLAGFVAFAEPDQATGFAATATALCGDPDHAIAAAAAAGPIEPGPNSAAPAGSAD